MARAMPESRLSSKGRPFHHQFSKTWALASTNAPAPSRRTSWREPSCSADGGSMVAAKSALMRPTAVWAAVACTCATPTPRVTTVLANRAPTFATSCAALPQETAGFDGVGLALSGGDPMLVDACSPCAAGSFATGTASPVSSDSSTSSRPSSSWASAEMRSPSCSTSRSPRTTSRPAMRCSLPSLITNARGADMSRRDSSARCVLRSCTSVMPITTNTKLSRNSASARSPSAK